MLKRINDQIRTQEVRLINENGQNLGIKPIHEALRLASETNLDLVEVSSNTTPPVCKILNYNKYIYDKKIKKRKTKIKKIELKEFQIKPNIDEGDLAVRIKRGKKFLQKGNMVKYTVKLRGREAAHPEIAELKLKVIQSELTEVSKVEKPPQRNGPYLISMTLMPK